jgi:hypothetical protein
MGAVPVALAVKVISSPTVGVTGAQAKSTSCTGSQQSPTTRVTVRSWVKVALLPLTGQT